MGRKDKKKQKKDDYRPISSNAKSIEDLAKEGWTLGPIIGNSPEQQRVLKEILEKAKASGNINSAGGFTISKEDAIRLNPNYANDMSNQGVRSAELGKFEEAKTYFEEALSVNPNMFGVWYNKGLAIIQIAKSKGLDYDFREDYREAIGCFDKAIKINPSFAPAWLNKGNALDRIGSKDEGWACLREGFRLQGH